MSRAPPSDGQTATERHSRGEKCFLQIRCTQEHGSADGEDRSCAGRTCTPVEIDVGRPVQERGEAGARAGPGRAGEEDADPVHGTARSAAGLGEGAEMQQRKRLHW